MTRLAFPASVALLALVLLLAGNGCDDPAEPSACLDMGRLQGTVSVGGPPEDALVRIKSVSMGEGNDANYEIHPDEQGHYGLDLPAGKYTLRISPTSGYSPIYDYTANGLGYGQVPPDTLTIDASVSPVEIDFRLGSATVVVEVSPLFEGRDCEVFLHLRDEDDSGYGPQYQDEGRAVIRGGRAEVHLAGVLPGEYRVALIVGADGRYWPCLHEGESFWMPGVPDEDSAPWYPVTLDSMATLTAVIDEEPALVEGRVTGAWIDFGLSYGPSLALFSPDSVEVAGLCRVDQDGRFSLPVLMPEPVKILVFHEGVERWIGGPGFADATVFDLQPGQVLSGIDIDQSGLRIDARGDKLDFWGPHIELYDATDMSLITTASWSQGPGNVTGIPNLWPGEFLLYFTPQGFDFGSHWWRPQWYDRALEEDLAQVVTITGAGQIVRLDVELERGGTVSGVVEGGEPTYFYRSVFVAPAEADVSWGYRTIFESRREFSLMGLPDGDYRLGLSPRYIDMTNGKPAPEGTIWYPGTTEWSAATVFEIRDAADITDLVFTLD